MIESIESVLVYRLLINTFTFVTFISLLNLGKYSANERLFPNCVLVVQSVFK